jgi:glycosyltransferase involved in cell wall biosynthesis
MPEICFITTCKGRLAHLRQTLGTKAAQPRSSCIVVDYSCPEQCGDWVEQNYPGVKVVRVTDEAGFSAARARNQGAQAADAPWLCFVDADIALAPSFVDKLLPLLQPGSYYRAKPWDRMLWGTMVCARADFTRIGGYDEMIQSYGGEDDDLYNRLHLAGVTLQGFPASLLQHLPHGDDLRIGFYDIKEKSLSQTINSLYAQVKCDLLKLIDQDLNPDARQRLYSTVRDFVLQARASGQEMQLQIPFRRERTFLGWVNTGKLTYVLGPK